MEENRLKVTDSNVLVCTFLTAVLVRIRANSCDSWSPFFRLHFPVSHFPVARIDWPFTLTDPQVTISRG